MTYNAKPYVERALAGIDFSRPRIALWVPPTLFHGLRSEYREQIQKAFPPRTVSVSVVDYPATLNFRKSVPVGVKILRTVLREIAKRGEYEVYLAGESQGGWVIGDVVGDPRYRKLFTRAVLLGHPAVASHHYTDDEKVLEINHPQDPFTRLPVGSPDEVLDTITMVLEQPLRRKNMRRLARAVVPNIGMLTQIGVISGLELGVLPNRVLHNTHCYDEYLSAGVHFCTTGQILPVNHTHSHLGILRRR